MRHFVRCVALSGIALALAGCDIGLPLRTGLNPVQEAFGWNAEKVMRDSWLAPLPYRPEPRYCYRTLAEADCFLRPQPHAAERLVGYVGPPPY